MRGRAPGADLDPERPVGEGFAPVVPYLQDGLVEVQRAAGALRQGRPQPVSGGEAAQDERGPLPLGRQDAGELPAGAQPPALVVHPDAAPVPLGRAFVVVQAGQHEAARRRVEPGGAGVLQQPGVAAVGDEPDPVADPPVDSGAVRDPAEQLVRPALGLAEEAVHRGAHAEDVVVFGGDQGEPATSAMFHDAHHARIGARAGMPVGGGWQGCAETLPRKVTP
ncbi:hypothetical protein [Actinomadura sp. WAC 06369]|uniref:hypothetical protein n=1 Tax=Actinomadura sp. WAC 06369 TaxID=2203193 RepID=UPI00131509C9|nr:hypothetical protein [Actinomadura sp. WAC 06369]